MLVVVCGVAGSGKTTIGTLLAERLGVPYADADEFHPESNTRKMAAGQALTDEDRKPWLTAIAAWLDSHESGVVSCSGLKRRYRDFLRGDRASVRLVFLDVSQDEIEKRLTTRKGHFFPEKLAGSQFSALEPPTEDEPVLVVDGSLTPDEIVAAIIKALKP